MIIRTQSHTNLSETHIVESIWNNPISTQV